MFEDGYCCGSKTLRVLGLQDIDLDWRWDSAGFLGEIGIASGFGKLPTNRHLSDFCMNYPLAFSL